MGRVTEQALRRLGIATVGDVAALPPDVLRRTLGSAAAERLRQLADGIDPRVVTAQVRERSIGHERTFSTDVADRAVVHREVLRLADQVARRLRHHALLARTVAVKVRYADFTTLTRSHTLSEPTDVGHRLHAEALALVDPLLADARPVRLVGVRAEQLVGETATPLWLPDAEWSQAERTVDALQARFGSAVVVPASLLASRENPEQFERSGSATPAPAPGRAPPERVYSTRTRESGEPG